jgi:hypothetical protein
MQEFLNIVFSMPSVPFTIALALVVAYWGLMIMGVVDLELFDIDVDLDLDLDVDVDGVDAGAGGIAGVLSALGLSGVPLTVTLSVLVFVGWCVTTGGALALGAAQDPLSGAITAGLFVGGAVAGVVGASLAARPLRGVFATSSGHAGARALVGESAKVTSSSVTAEAGRGVVTLEGVDAQVSLRCDEPGNGLGRGDEALIVDYDPATHVYSVVPMESAFGAGDAEEADEVDEEARAVASAQEVQAAP